MIIKRTVQYMSISQIKTETHFKKLKTQKSVTRNISSSIVVVEVFTL